MAKELREGSDIGSNLRVEDARFEAHVRDTIDEWVAAGKNVIPLTRSLLPPDELKSSI